MTGTGADHRIIDAARPPVTARQHGSTATLPTWLNGRACARGAGFRFDSGRRRVDIREPTPEECSERATVGDGRACWYPSTGGYVGRSLVVLDDGCVDVYVWHDGNFPFGGDDRPPVVLHHCSGDQFVSFGLFLDEIQGSPGQA